MIEGRMWTEDEEKRRANVVVLGHDAAEDLFPNEAPARARRWSARATSSPSSASSTTSRSPSAAAGIPKTIRPIFPVETFRKIHPEIKDYLARGQVRRREEQAAGHRGNSRAAAPPPQGARRAGRQLRHLRPRLAQPAVELAYRRPFPLHGRGLDRRPDGRAASA